MTENQDKKKDFSLLGMRHKNTSLPQNLLHILLVFMSPLPENPVKNAMKSLRFVVRAVNKKEK
jgi:hypothetical protein